jgi:hypothetical protein
MDRPPEQQPRPDDERASLALVHGAGKRDADGDRQGTQHNGRANPDEVAGRLPARVRVTLPSRARHGTSVLRGARAAKRPCSFRPDR